MKKTLFLDPQHPYETPKMSLSIPNWGNFTRSPSAAMDLRLTITKNLFQYGFLWKYAWPCWPSIRSSWPVDPYVPFSDAHIYPASTHIGSPTRCVQWQRLRCGSWHHGGIARFLVKGPLGGNGNGFFDMGWILVWKIARGVSACQSVEYVEWSHLERVPKDAKSSTTVTCLERNGLRSKQYAVWKGSAWVK